MKYYRVLSVIVILLFVGIVFDYSDKDKSMEILRLSWYTKSEIQTHDPANIQFAAPAVLLMNIYSPLMIYNNKSEISFGLAEKFQWISESEIQFKIKSNLLSSKGDRITSEDAYLSFKRLMIKQTNTHGNLQSFLCPDFKLKNISDLCQGIRFDNNSIYLKAINPKIAKFILPLITNCDFVVIPKNAIDWNSSDLKIIDYSNTSGPFYVESTNEKGEHTLAGNAYSPLYSKEMPQKIKLIPVLDTSSTKKLLDGEIDMISTIDRAQADDLIKLENNKKLNFHKTTGLDVTAMHFSSVGRDRLNINERFALAKLIKKTIISSWPEKSALSQVDQFFPPFGEASLDEKQMLEINKLIEKSAELPSKNITISVEGEKLDWFKKRFSEHSNINFIKFNGIPNFKSKNEMEDAFIVPGDTGFLENISLISYYMSTGFFGYEDRDSANKWIQNYMMIEDKETRLNMLKELHYDFLSRGIIIPISISPYFAVVNSAWNLDFYKNFAGTPLWMMRKN